MELQFEPRPMKYLCKILQETKNQEETMEIIVPDSYPDVHRMLCGSAVAVARSKEEHTGCVMVSGGIQCRVLYVAEGEKVPKCLEGYMPFQVKVESPQLTDSARTTFQVHVKNVDVRMLNSRKIMIRVNLCWTLTAYDTCQQTLYTLTEQPHTLQTYTAEYTFGLPAETAERSFQMTETLQFSGSRPLVGEVYRFEPRLELTELRIAGNKAVFKGLAHLRALYGTRDDALAVQEAEIPFSQYCELADTYEEEELDLKLTLQGCETERTMQPDGEALTVTMQILAQCVVRQNHAVQMVEDAYCVDGELVPQWETYAFVNRLDRQTFNRTQRESREMDIADVVDAWACREPVQMVRSEGGMLMTVPVNVNLLYLNGKKEYHFMSFRSEVTEKIPMHESAGCHVQAEISGQVMVVPAGNTMELRYPVTMTVECVAEGAYRSLCGGEIRAAEKKQQKRPAVIVRRTRSGETLWDIAKASGTTVEKIRRANHMDTETTEAGVLLIPT